MKEKLFQALLNSVIVQSIVTLLFTCALLYMVVNQIEVPKEVWISYGAILGFWFGTKSQEQVHRAYGTNKQD